MAALLRIDGNVEWKCLQANGGNWVAACESLKLRVQAETWADLMEDIALTMDSMFRDLLSANELTKFLRDHGWTLVGTIPTRPEEAQFDIPFTRAMVGSHGSNREF